MAANSRSVAQAVDAKIPVVIFDSDLQGDAFTSFVATDNKAAGKLAGDTVIRAPMDGIIGERYVNVGEYVQPPTRVASVFSVNPARSTGPALVVGGSAVTQLWLFWLAPIVGALLAGATWRALFDRGEPDVAGR